MFWKNVLIKYYIFMMLMVLFQKEGFKQKNNGLKDKLIYPSDYDFIKKQTNPYISLSDSNAQLLLESRQT